jgi:hypothetical protein
MHREKNNTEARSHGVERWFPRALRARPTLRHRATHGGNQLVLSVRPHVPRASVLFFVNRRELPAIAKPGYATFRHRSVAIAPSTTR